MPKLVALSSNTFALLPANLSQTLSKQQGSGRGIFKKSSQRGFPLLFYFLNFITIIIISLDSCEERREGFGQL